MGNSEKCEEYVHSLSGKHPPLDALDVAKLLRNKVLMIHGESTAEQLRDTFLKFL